MYKKLMLAMVVASTFGLSACSEGDKSTLIIEGDTTNNNGGGDGGGGNGQSDCPTWASARSQDSAGNDVCQLPSTILQDRTLTSGIIWYMADRVTVGNGNGEMSATAGTLANGSAVTNVTLTIEAGTQIKGATGTFANLIITRGSKINAIGTADAPIIFSSEDADYTGAGEWGGLIIHGYGDHNQCTTAGAACNIDSEGESGFAGGNGHTDDNSGTLRYVIVTEAGYEFAPGNEINGISFMSVGSGTTVDYVQVNDSSDDGIEMYGGNVNFKHLVLTNVLDDSIDWDEGYQGNIQYALVKQSSASEGNAVEADTEGTTVFFSKPTVANVTFIGAGTQATEIVLKASSGGFFHNSVFTRADGSVVTSCVTVTGNGAQNNRNVRTAFTNIISDCGSFGDSVLTQDTVYATAAALNANYASTATQAQLTAPYDWAAFKTAYPESVADTDYLDATDFLGAVNPDGSDLWFQGWTLEGSI